MKKLMLLAAMLAMALMAASPAFAQIDQSEDNDTVINDSSVDCTQVIAQLGSGAGDDQYGGGGAGGGDDQYDDSDDVAEEGQEQSNEQLAGENAQSEQTQDFTAEEVQECLSQAGAGNLAAQNVGDVNGDGVVNELDILAVVEGSSENGNGENGNGGKTLPDTGGASLLALGAGALLVAGGLIARRIVR